MLKYYVLTLLSDRLLITNYKSVSHNNYTQLIWLRLLYYSRIKRSHPQGGGHIMTIQLRLPGEDVDSVAPWASERRAHRRHLEMLTPCSRFLLRVGTGVSVHLVKTIYRSPQSARPIIYIILWLQTRNVVFIFLHDTRTKVSKNLATI
jgi:hypothetical protein